MKFTRVAIGLAAVVVAAGCGSSGKQKQQSTGEALRPPVIHEGFKSLPCPARPVSLTQIKGCEQRALLKSDRQVDARVKQILRLNLTTAGRAAFIRSESAWLSYRKAACSAGGSASIGNLECKAMQNARHLIELAEWPCSRSAGRIQDEFCLRDEVARSDRKIKAQERALLRLIGSGTTRAPLLRNRPEPTRVAFLRSERSWFSYRREVCVVEAAKYSGGSEQPNVFLSCEVERNAEHMALLLELDNYFNMR